MRAEGEAGHHTEVSASATPQGPVEIRVGVTVRGAQLAVRGDDLRAQHIVRGETEVTAGEAHPAAERMPGDPHRRARPGGDRQPAGRERGVHVDQLRAGAHRRRAVVHVDADPAHIAQIEHQATGQRRVAGVAVPAGPSPQRHAIGHAPADRRPHVGRVDGASHPRRQHVVVALVVDVGSGRESRRTALDDLAADRRPGTSRGLADHRPAAPSIGEPKTDGTSAGQERTPVDSTLHLPSPFLPCPVHPYRPAPRTQARAERAGRNGHPGRSSMGPS